MSPSGWLRRYARIRLPRGMYIAWQGKGQRVVSRVGTLGLGGLFLDARDPAPVGEIIKIYFQIPGGDVRARVVGDSHPGRGMGVEFTAMEHEARARLDRLLRKLIADPKIPHLNEQLALRK